MVDSTMAESAMMMMLLLMMTTIRPYVELS